MIIDSSNVKMASNRKFASMRRTSSPFYAVGKISSSSGMFVKTAVSTTQTAIDKDSGNETKKNAASGSPEDLMSRFSQSRSIRGTGLEHIRSLQSIHQIRTRSISYMLRQFFWGNRWGQDPLAALFADRTNGLMDPSFTLPSLNNNYTFIEEEQTSFATEGTVVTASGKEISFNLELSMSRSFYEESASIVDFSSIQLTDPLVINLDTEVASVSDQKFYFDLDADGRQEQISKLGAGSGFLALDKNGDGIINDGSELFGALTGNGFAELAKYDQDGNGWIDEADEIFNKLLIWQKDEQGNDVLRGLGAAGVGAIYLGSANTNFSLNSATDNHTNAVIRQTGMFLYENGESGTMQQVDLAQ